MSSLGQKLICTSKRSAEHSQAGAFLRGGGKNWVIFGLRHTVFEICMFEGDGVWTKSPPGHNPDRPHALSPVHRPSVRRPSVAGGLSVGPGSTVHVCGLTAVVVWVSGYTAPVCLLMVRGPVCIWCTRVSHVSTAVSATWVVYTQQTRRRVGRAPSAHVPTVVCLWSLSEQTG